MPCRTNEAGAFRFLDLPKELRLMVYASLIIKTTHHGDETLTLVHRTLPGIAILATCSLINNEASVILNPRLTAIKSQPVRLIVEDFDGPGVVHFLHRLSEHKSNRDRLQDTRDIMQDVRYTYHKEEKSPNVSRKSLESIPTHQICIAYCHHHTDGERFVVQEGPNFGKASMSLLVRLKCVQMNLTGQFRKDEIIQFRLLELQIRPAVFPLGQTDCEYLTATPYASMSLVRTQLSAGSYRMPGPTIEELEWQRDWAEGER
jgi:hypothetical protein